MVILYRELSLTTVVSLYHVTVGWGTAVHAQMKMTEDSNCWMLGFCVNDGAWTFFPAAGASTGREREWERQWIMVRASSLQPGQKERASLASIPHTASSKPYQQDTQYPSPSYLASYKIHKQTDIQYETVNNTNVHGLHIYNNAHLPKYQNRSHVIVVLSWYLFIQTKELGLHW